MNKLRRIYNFIRYDLPIGSRNLKEYAKIIWNDRDWDHNYLYSLIIFKLKRMEKCQENAMHCNGAKEAKRIRIARVALERAAEGWNWADEESVKHVNWDSQGESLPLFKHYCDLSERIRKQGLEIFAKQFVKYSMGWWD